METPKKRFLLKDQLFNKESMGVFADYLLARDPNFPKRVFIRRTSLAFPNLELKERIAYITELIHKLMNVSYPKALSLLLESLPAELDPSKTDGDFGNFILAPFSLYLAKYGCNKIHLNISLLALKEMTKRFSCEYALRFFINAFPEETMNYLKLWATDANYHVRRLVSEGTRPHLPWAQGIVYKHTESLVLLDELYKDSTRYVTRSVANHMNDISKNHPKITISRLKKWQVSGKQESTEMKFITRHSLRTLIKQGHPEALELMGFTTPDIQLRNFTINTPVVHLGESLSFSFAIQSTSKQSLLVDYLIHFAHPQQKRTKKVFKITQLEIEIGQQISLNKSHPLRLMSTKKLYQGEHSVELQINGVSFGFKNFELKL